MQHPRILYNAAITACEKSEKWQAAVQLLSDLTVKLGCRSENAGRIIEYGAANDACCNVLW